MHPDTPKSPDSAKTQQDSAQTDANPTSLPARADTPNVSDAPDVPDEASELRLRRIRSFVTRAGRVSTGQRRALDELGPRFVLPFDKQALDWDERFGRPAPRIL